MLAKINIYTLIYPANVLHPFLSDMEVVHISAEVLKWPLATIATSYSNLFRLLIKVAKH